jgi:hypothetical protein
MVRDLVPARHCTGVDTASLEEIYSVKRFKRLEEM